ncbi:hypothetical protein C0J52_06815 [Blattella germanica]|nr:hypothetical protein C0J52_06815 [Blattella germanica]
MVEIENNNKTPVSQSDESNGVPTIISASVINPDFVTVSNRRAKLKKGLAKLELKEKFENRKSLCVTSGIINALLLIVAIGFIVLWTFRLINSMDKGFDACDDFYQFVCGNWQLQNPASNLLTEEIYRKEPLALQLAKKLYKECMKTELIEHLGMHSLKELLVTLGLPKELPNKNESENFDLTGTLSTIQYHLPLTDALLTVGLTVHPKDETKRMILLSMPKKERMYKIQSLVRHDPDYIVGKRKKRSVPIFVTDEVKYRTTVMEIFENEKVHGEKLNETILRAAAFKTVTVETDLSNVSKYQKMCFMDLPI